MNSATSMIKKKRGMFWSLLGALLLLIMVRYAFQIDVPRIVFLFIIALIANYFKTHKASSKPVKSFILIGIYSISYKKL